MAIELDKDKGRPVQPGLLRTVPTFVNAHTFCASRKPWFRHYARAWLDTDAINYAIKYTTKMKANFFYRD